MQIELKAWSTLFVFDLYFQKFLCAFLCGLCVICGSKKCIAAETDQFHVGLQPDGRIVVPTNQILKPAGAQVTFPGRPVDLAWSGDGKFVLIKNMKAMLVYDLEKGELKAPLTSQVGFSVTGILASGNQVCVTDARDRLLMAASDGGGVYKWSAEFSLPPPAGGGAPNPAGIARNDDGVWVACTRGNCVCLLDPRDKKTSKIDVGVAPFTVVITKAGKAYVSNWGGNPPEAGAKAGVTSGTRVRIDERTGVANDGSVSVIEKKDGQFTQVRAISVGLHPCGLALNKAESRLFVTNANSDTLSVIDTAADTVIETIDCKPDAKLPLGSGSNALALSPDGAVAYVANGANNCVCVVKLSARASGIDGGPAVSAISGLIPTGWYPGAILVTPDSKKLIVANVKGAGSLAQKDAAKGHNTHDHLGSISIIDVPDAAQLAAYTREVNENNRLAYSLAGLEKPRADAKSIPIPERHGEPSPIKHVVYVIKENRTYDQVFGDIKEGNGEPKFTLFGEDVTPNQHALAREFTLFDNFYCSGVLSADGHSWVNEAFCTDYLEKSFGEFVRSYPDEMDDALAFHPTAFLWDNALTHNKTFFNFGEGTHVEPALKWAEAYAEHKNGRRLKFNMKIALSRLKDHTHPEYPGWTLKIPDVYRASIFLEELKTFDKKNEFPNLVYVYLPNNHTSGTKAEMPIPKSMVADNDLACGQVIEAITHTTFWPETAIFVIEDDSQNGVDHVDGHRAPMLVISPYAKRKFVDHTCYNQTGVVKTMELILGLPPMNQLDLSATAMRACFQEQPDLTPFKCLETRIALDTMNPAADKQKGSGLFWSNKSEALCFDEPDCANEDILNRVVWFSVKGDDAYPVAFAGEDDDD
jgi:YVTN family beta-propeller protein